MMRVAGRRSFLQHAVLFVSAISFGIDKALGQPKPKKLGLLYLASQQSFQATGRADALIKGMRDARYVEGKDFVIEARFADSKEDKLATLARELVDLRVDVILTVGSQASHAAFQSTATIPIVIAAVADPIAEGYAVSLGRPGRNVTGLTSNLDVMPKQLDLLMAVVPKIARLAVLHNTANAGHERFLNELRASARKRNVAVFTVDGRPPMDFSSTFRSMKQQRADALVILGDTYFLEHAEQLGELSLKYKIPSIYPAEQFVRKGGLLSYGFDVTRSFYLVADFIDKIFKGSSPAMLPFAQQDAFDLVINRTTAKTLGLRVPDALLLRADKLVD